MTAGESSTEIKQLPFLGGSIFDADAGSIFGAYLQKNLRAVQLLLGHSKVESTVRYLGIELDDALEIAEQTEI